MKTPILLLLCLIGVIADDAAIDEFKIATSKFGSDVYQKIAEVKKDNFLFSPISAEVILTLAYLGARGTTAEELRTSLHLPNDTAKLQEGIKTLLPTLKRKDDYTLQVANKVYVKETFKIKDEFKNIATDVFQADTENIDFAKKVEASQTINNWTGEKTNNKIKDIISADVLNNDTRVILVNALYFKADWLKPFLIADTDEINFYKTEMETVKVPALQSAVGDHFLYYECHEHNGKFLELPFKGGEASLTIFLPNEKTGLKDVENSIHKILGPHELTKELVDVALPKFKITSQTDLKDILQKLGVITAFKDFEADLSGVAGAEGDLVVSKVVKQTFIDVNEEGVEAAAATLILIGNARTLSVDKPKKFIADHPFIFYIKIQGVIAFVGRVSDPSK